MKKYFFLLNIQFSFAYSKFAEATDLINIHTGNMPDFSVTYAETRARGALHTISESALVTWGGISMDRRLCLFISLSACVSSGNAESTPFIHNTRVCTQEPRTPSVPRQSILHRRARGSGIHIFLGEWDRVKEKTRVAS